MSESWFLRDLKAAEDEVKRLQMACDEWDIAYANLSLENRRLWESRRWWRMIAFAGWWLWLVAIVAVVIA